MTDDERDQADQADQDHEQAPDDAQDQDGQDRDGEDQDGEDQDGEDQDGEQSGTRADGAPADDRERREAAQRAAEKIQGDDGPDDRTLLDGHDVEAALLPDWRIMFGALHARFRTGDFATGVRLVDGIGEAADAADHHPDVDLRYGHVDVRLSSHDVGGVTMRDVRLARQVSDLAEGVQATPAPASLSVVELALDTHDRDEVKDFWAALLGLQETDDDERELQDPDGRLPTVWFQEAERTSSGTGDGEGSGEDGVGGPGQRWHLDVRVPPEEAERRIKAALDAGGRMVSDGRAPSFWVLADRQGNQACVTTWLGRE